MTHNIYIDYTHSVPYGNIKFHGGANYTKKIIIDLIEYQKLEKINIFWPMGYMPKDSIEKLIYNNEKTNIIEIERIEDYKDFKLSSILFFPLLNIKSWKKVKKIKNNSLNIRVYLTIHGLRVLDLGYDKYDKFYNRLYYPLFSSVFLLFKKMYYSLYVKKNIVLFDKIFTVSNFSLQQIVKHCKSLNITHFYQGVNVDESKIINKIDDSYVLFVSGNRAEKNFARALEAFTIYKNRHIDSKIFLYVTGIGDNLKNKLLNSYSKKDVGLINNHVKFFDYVDDQMLSDLYKQCLFLLYTSKSEGFGLPVMEAMLNLKPVVSSYITAIPEVGGSAVYYVDPMSTESITNGIIYMTDPNNNARYVKYVTDSIDSMKTRVDQDKKRFVDILIND